VSLLDFPGVSGLIFVVDSNDEERIGEAREWLHGPHLLAHPLLAGVPMLVFANKEDLPSVMSPSMIADRMGLHGMENERQVHVQGCSAQTGEGLSEGLEWLSTKMKK
jgi:signal recognition particle receptor subunit beta